MVRKPDDPLMSHFLDLSHVCLSCSRPFRRKVLSRFTRMEQAQIMSRSYYLPNILALKCFTKTIRGKLSPFETCLGLGGSGNKSPLSGCCNLQRNFLSICSQHFQPRRGGVRGRRPRPPGTQEVFTTSYYCCSLEFLKPTIDIGA